MQQSRSVKYLLLLNGIDDIVQLKTYNDRPAKKQYTKYASGNDKIIWNRPIKVSQKERVCINIAKVVMNADPRAIPWLFFICVIRILKEKTVDSDRNMFDQE